MKTFILINAIVEIGAGLVFFLFPRFFPELKGASNTADAQANMFGGAIISLGLFALLVWQNYDDGGALTNVFLLTFMAFHTLIAIAAFKGYLRGGFFNPAVAILHTVLAAGTVYFYMQMGVS